ncbi:MAG: diacylglycerol kinase [Alphaproteobacteria bacterium]|nr:diacylglycerol kinase [Alphaproteobacteria bacterium]
MRVLKRLYKATLYSMAGLRTVFRDEVAFKQELLLLALGFGVLPFLNVEALTKVLLGFSLVSILIAELINTAIENVVDRIGTEYHELSKKAKDIGSALVFLTIVCVAIFWCLLILYV